MADDFHAKLKKLAEEAKNCNVLITKRPEIVRNL
jgi:hypothetical protein